MAISQKQIDNIISSIDIVDVIGRFIDVQKKGANYVAVCPFHDDSSPSLSISPQKKIFKCFPCGVSGTAISFIQEFKHINFYKAVKEIADMYNIKLEGYIEVEEKSKYNDLQKKILEINKYAATYFSVMLKGSVGINAKKYLDTRHITYDEIRRFNIGYAAKQSELMLFLNNLGYSKEEVYKSGLMYLNNAKQTSFFYDRIVFPIKDEDSNIIGFSGRIMSAEKDIPKYKNTAENEVFKKSALAYNFDNAKKQARINGDLIILEGFMDVISLERIGVNNSIAIMGTSLSNYHMQLFSSVTKNIKLFLDGDKPGIEAALKISKQLYEYGFNVTIINNTTGKDPDELVNSGDHKILLDMIANPKTIEDFAYWYYSQSLKPNDSGSASEFVDDMIKVLTMSKNEIGINQIILKMADDIKVSKEVIEQKYLSQNKQKFKQIASEIPPEFVPNEPSDGFFGPIDDFVDTHNIIPKNKKERSASFVPLKYRNTENHLIYSLLNSPSYLEEVSKIVDKFNLVVNKKIAETIIEYYKSDDFKKAGMLKIEDNVKDMGDKFQEQLMEIKYQSYIFKNKEITKGVFQDSEFILEEYKYKDEIDERTKKMIELQRTWDALKNTPGYESDGTEKKVIQSYSEYIEELRKNLKKSWKRKEDQKNGN